jgi:glycosyltransferase involved in cell wall biosynthesis
LVSVIIPTLNEERYLQKCLTSLKKQEGHDNFEIIIVDGRSSDNTLKIAEKFTKNVMLSNIQNPGIQRNLGAEKAKGKILAFIDADTVASKNWLESIVKTFQDKRVVAVTGPLLPLEKIRMWRLYKFVNNLQKILTKINYPLFWGASCAFRTTAFWKVKGFDKTLLTSEDHDISLKIKKIGRVLFNEDVLAYTSHRRFLKNKREGISLYVKDIFDYFILKKIRKHTI